MKQEVLGRINGLFLFDVTRTAQRTTPPTIHRYSENALTELFPSNDTEILRITLFTELLPTNGRIQCTEPWSISDKNDIHTRALKEGRD
jgi:hypothetical protein